MRSDVAQAVALCGYANAFLGGQCEKPPELLARNSAFRTTHELTFERTGKGLAQGVIADATGPWIRRLEKEGVTRVRLALEHCPLDPREISGEPWGLVTDGDVGVEIWQPNWRKRIRAYSDPAPWRVSYCSQRLGRWAGKPQLDLTLAAFALDRAIQLASTRPPFAFVFKNPREEPEPTDLLPENWFSKGIEAAESAMTIVTLLRTEDFIESVRDAGEESLAKTLWKASLFTLQAALNAEPLVWEHPSSQDFLQVG